MVETYLPDFLLILPEILLILTALLILGGGVIRQTPAPRHFGYMALGGLLLAFCALLICHKAGESWTSFEGQVLQNDFIYFGKIIIFVSAAAVLILSLTPLLHDQLLSFEYAALILFATSGMLLMLSANDFLNLFVALEIQGLSLYILAALNRDSGLSAEAALKYFILGAVATAFYLYGTSLLYGFAGSTHFEVLARSIHMDVAVLPLGLCIGLLFIISAFAFKMSAAPFHMWTPDVYEGCPTAIVAFIANAPKGVAALVLLRLLMDPFLILYPLWSPLFLGLAVLSMVWGTLAALSQTNIKRFLAYSTIAQMGYVCLGLATGVREGLQGVLVYVSLYLVMMIGVFGSLLCLRNKKAETFDSLAGFGSLHPCLAFFLALLMFSLAGIPPFAGFFAKFYIFKAAIAEGFVSIAVLGMVTSVVAAFYYLRIIKIMYFKSSDDLAPEFYGQTVVASSGMGIVLILCAGVLLFFCLFPDPFLLMVQRASLVFTGF